MRDGRRQRLGLANGTEDPATSNDGYLDRILSDQEAAEQSNILNLAQDASGLTSTETALLSPEEQAIRLRQRGQA